MTASCKVQLQQADVITFARVLLGNVKQNIPFSSASFSSPKEFAIVCKYSIPLLWALFSHLSGFRLSEHSYHKGRIHTQ